MKISEKIAGKSHTGMTLMEVVIAIGVVAFVIPLILAATGSAGNSRRNAEADTHSAWIARDVQQNMIVAWGDHPEASGFKESLSFPVLGTENTPEIFIYKSDGTFLEKGSQSDFTASSQVTDAAYVVAVHAVLPPANVPAAANSLSLLSIRVLHPAKAAPSTRSTYRYNVITTKQGTL